MSGSGKGGVGTTRTASLGSLWSVLPLATALVLVALPAGAVPRAPKAVPPALAAIRMTVLGDSLAFGVGASDPKNALAFSIYRALLAERPGSEVTNDAIGGTRAADVMRLEVPQVEAHTDLVLVIVGGNDVVRHTSPARFADDYGRLLAAIRARAPDAVVVACGVPDVARSPLFADSFAKTEALSRSDDTAVRAATHTYGVAYVDLFTPTRADGTNPDFFSSDDFHPSDAGYAQLARVTLPVVLRALADRGAANAAKKRSPG